MISILLERRKLTTGEKVGAYGLAGLMATGLGLRAYKHLQSDRQHTPPSGTGGNLLNKPISTTAGSNSQKNEALPEVPDSGGENFSLKDYM